MYSIPFNRAAQTGNEITLISEALKAGNLAGDGFYTKACEKWLESNLGTKKALLTSSCTASLELSAMLCDIGEGDEVIVPSYTFVSTANAFVLRGARIVFVDIDSTTMNISLDRIKEAITPKTRAVVPVHYAGVGCDMKGLMALAEECGFWVIEDAAQALMSNYRGEPLGTLGHLGCFSFHETKNYTSGGEGGALLVNDKQLIKRAEILREKGTDRGQFRRGEVDKYTWRDIGSSFLMSELQAAYLFAQFESAEIINQYRLRVWNKYFNALSPLNLAGKIELPFIPKECKHNAHMFYIKLKDYQARSKLIDYLKERDILAVFHYVPLHSSPAGKRFGVFNGVDEYTTSESDKLLRLPIWYGISDQDVEQVVANVISFFE